MQYDTKRATLSGVVGALRLTGGDNPRLNFQLEQTLPGRNNEPRVEREQIVAWGEQAEAWRQHLQNGMRIRIDDARPSVRSGDDGTFINYTIDRMTQISVLLGGEVRSMPGPDYTEQPPAPAARPAARPVATTAPARPATAPVPAAAGPTPVTPRPAGPPRLPAARPAVPVRPASTPTVAAPPVAQEPAPEPDAPNAKDVIARLRNARSAKKNTAEAVGAPDY